MTPRQKSVKKKWLPVFDRPQMPERQAPFEVHAGPIVTLHYDRAGAEGEVRWQREKYGREAEIVQHENTRNHPPSHLEMVETKENQNTG